MPTCGTQMEYFTDAVTWCLLNLEIKAVAEPPKAKLSATRAQSILLDSKG